MALKEKTTGKLIVATALVAALALPFAATAKGEGRQGQRASFEQLDADGNGEITQAEMAARGQARFDEADTNGDGFLSKQEAIAWMGQRAADRIDRMFESRDANEDGQLSFEETRPDEDRVAKRFERVDTDENGSISKAEFEEAGKRRGGKRRGNN